MKSNSFSLTILQKWGEKESEEKARVVVGAKEFGGYDDFMVVGAKWNKLFY